MTRDEQLISLYGSNKILGPYLCRDGRTRVDVEVDGAMKTVLLAKLILEVKLNRRLSEDETVDHIDENKFNDKPINLQVLSLSENARKSAVLNNTADRFKFWLTSEDTKSKRSEIVRGENCGMAKLTNIEVSDIRSRKRYYGMVRDLMQEFDLSRRSIQNILHDKSYK